MLHMHAVSHILMRVSFVNVKLKYFEEKEGNICRLVEKLKLKNLHISIFLMSPSQSFVIIYVPHHRIKNGCGGSPSLLSNGYEGLFPWK